MSTNNISCVVKAAGAYGLQLYHLYVQTVMKSGSLNRLEPSGLVQGCIGIDLPLLWNLLMSSSSRQECLGDSLITGKLVHP
jgi:hypothetical protein